MIEEADYRVTATLSVVIKFSPIERETRLSKHDAIANAMGTVPDEVWEALEDACWSVKFAAERWS